MSRGEMFDDGDMISHLWNTILICSFGDCSCQKEKKKKDKLKKEDLYLKKITEMSI